MSNSIICIYVNFTQIRLHTCKVLIDVYLHWQVTCDLDTVPSFTKSTTAQQRNVGNIRTKFHPYPSVTVQVQVHINLCPHGTEPLLSRNKFHRDKYGCYQSLNVTACFCCLSGLATFSTDAVCYCLLQTETQILVLFLLCNLPSLRLPSLPFPSPSKISKFHLVAGFLSNLNNNFLAPICLFLCRQSSRHHFSASSLVVYSLLSSPSPIFLLFKSVIRRQEMNSAVKPDAGWSGKGLRLSSLGCTNRL